jgi:serine/threonine protein phosphatase 1
MAARFKEIEKLPKRLFVVGDIHGCATETELLINHLRSVEKLDKDDMLCFIGDYIDRGPDSKQVIELMLELKRELPATIFLKGNHEDMLLNFLGYEGTNSYSYLQNGGMLTLQSYEVATPENLEEVVRRLTQQHIEFFRTLDNYVIVGPYILAHAGLHPLKPLREQSSEDIFWIRDEFIQNIHHFEKTVVFGHTPYWEVLFHLPYKIGIDTGLVYGNRLSCIELNQKQIFQIKRGEIQITTSTFDEAIKLQEERAAAKQDK